MSAEVASVERTAASGGFYGCGGSNARLFQRTCGEHIGAAVVEVPRHLSTASDFTISFKPGNRFKREVITTTL